jgi:hypothetical protein
MSIIIPDIEIEDKDKDLLKFTRYVDALHKIIINGEIQFTIGLFGGWGRGKTSLMKMLMKRIYKQGFDEGGIMKADVQKLYIPIWFDAWMYERESNLLTPFLDNFRYQMNEMFSKVKNKNLSRLSKRIGQVIFSLLKATSIEVGVYGSKVTFDSSKALEGLKDGRKKEYQSAYCQSIKEIQDIFKEFSGFLGERKIVFVVFIDDLDRCLPEKALHVLEIVKNLIFIKGYFFVVGLDPKPIEDYIDYKYQKLYSEGKQDLVRGAQYIKKIFQLRFEIPPVTEENAKEFIAETIKRANFGEIPDIGNLVKYLTVDHDINPREIKLFINKMILHTSIKRRPSNWENFFRIQIFSFRSDFEIFYEKLKENGAPLLRYLCNNNIQESSGKKEFEEVKNKVVDNNPRLKDYLDNNSSYFANITADDFKEYFYLEKHT